jgi:tetratricopeptide (TPR) repeat protein
MENRRATHIDGSRIYGRELQLARFEKLLTGVDGEPRDGVGKVALLAGNSGVGKSALAHLAVEMAKTLGFETFRIACEPFHEGMSFFPVRELVRQMAGGRSAGEAVADLFGANSPQAEIAAVSESASADAQSRREALVATFTNAIFGRFKGTENKPLLLFIDDLEHLDAGSADALICLIARLSEGPVVLLGAYRTDLVFDTTHPLRTVIASARRADNALLTIPLDGFALGALPSLTKAILDGECDLPIAFYDKLYRETEGNPLFIREVLRALTDPVDTAAEPPLVVRDGLWRYHGSIDLWAIPPSIEDAVATRLDHLEPEHRHELELAAVIGRRFAFEVLSNLMEAGEDELLRHLEDLLNFDLIRELDEGDDSFEFSHGKIRDVLYQSLSGLRRRRLHAQVADVLRRLQGAADEDWDALIGEHLFRAANHAEAFQYLLRAARDARKTGSNRESVSLFRKALVASEGAILDVDDSRQSIRLELSEALLATSETEEAGALLEQLILPEVDSKIRAWALNYLGDALLLDGDIDQAIAQYAICEQLARGTDNVDLIGEVCCDLGELHGRQYERLVGLDLGAANDHERLHEAYAAESFELVDSISNGETRARVFRNMAKRSRVQGDLPRAITLYEKSLSAVDPRASGHRFLIPYAKALRLAGRTSEALRIVDRVLAWSSQVGSRRSEAIAWQYRGLILMMASTDGESLDEARDCLNQALQQHRVIGFRQGLHETEMLLGEAAIRSDDPTAALEHFGRTIGRRHLPASELLATVAAELEANGENDRAAYVRTYVEQFSK